MIRTLAQEGIPPLKPQDTAQQALDILQEYHVQHLPVVDDSGKLIGVVSEDQLLEADPQTEVKQLLQAKPISIDAESHTFDATKLMVQHQLTTLPVVEDDQQYVGLLDRHHLFEKYTLMLSAHEPGAILVVEMDPRDYSLGQLAYIIEQNNAHIRSVFTEPPTVEGAPFRVTLKLDVQECSRIKHVLEHYGYRVTEAFSDASNDEELRQRIEAFMRFLEV